MEANNIKAMRDALDETQSVIEKCMEILNRIPDGVEYDGLIDDVADELCYLRDSHVKPALSAPPRNCDVGTAEEQEKRFAEYCDSEACKRNLCKSRAKALCIERCAIAWAQMPYESEVK